MALCFQVSVNNDRPITVGADRADNVSAHVYYVVEHRRVELHVQGIVSTGEHASELWSWLEREDLKIGDEVVIRIVASENPEQPIRRVSEGTAFDRH